ncbi:sodium:calcium antiporter [Parasphingorhabdus sp.]|uniref:sodium:calcium antiporter n=1 Tax=Parasphingorhabdus sp. TaxID=2709688 RepID=UPI003D2CCF1E
MTTLIFCWVLFGLCAILILAAGPRLTRNAEIIAAKKGLSDEWVGLILLASITSLPELAAGVSSVTLANAPDIAVGAVFGSCVFNLVMLVVLDFAVRGESVYRQARQAHILSAGFGIMLVGFAGLTMMVGGFGINPSIGHLGVGSFVIIGLYIIATRAIYNYEAKLRESAALEAAKELPEQSLSQAQKTVVYAAIAILIGGSLLPVVGAEIADRMAIGRGFMGTIFVAAATSLPELTVSLAALRQGSVNMAIANLLGSNLFNILILAVEDGLYLKAPLLESASPIHVATAMAAMVMTGVVIAGLLYRPKTRLFRTVGWTSIALFTVYLVNAYIVYLSAS